MLAVFIALVALALFGSLCQMQRRAAAAEFAVDAMRQVMREERAELARLRANAADDQRRLVAFDAIVNGASPADQRIASLRLAASGDISHNQARLFDATGIMPRRTPMVPR